MPSPVRVLVVDDSRYIRGLMQSLLSPFYVVQTAVDGRDCLDQLPSFVPDVILLDLNMPRLGGLAVIEKLRGELNAPDIYVIVLTSDETPEVKAKALNLGANDFLTKRFDQEELFARMGVAARQILLMRQIAEEVRTVAGLQARLLPPSGYSGDGVTVQGLYRSSGLASGDYFDYIPLPGGGLRLTVADVSGHGARAAFLMAIARTLFRQCAVQGLALPEALAALNETLIDIVGEDKDFITILAADLDPVSRTLTWVNAGHCPGLVLTPDREVLELKPGSPMLGFFPGLDLTAQVLRLDGPFQAFFYTDGFYEWETSPGNMFGLEPFLDLCRDMLLAGRPILDELVDALTVETKSRPVFRDDLTALWAGCD